MLNIIQIRRLSEFYDLILMVDDKRNCEVRVISKDKSTLIDRAFNPSQAWIEKQIKEYPDCHIFYNPNLNYLSTFVVDYDFVDKREDYSVIIPTILRTIVEKLKPTFVVFTGGGFQVGWRLDKKIPIRAKGKTSKVQNLLQNLDINFPQISELLQQDVSSFQSIKHFFRMPFSINPKYNSRSKLLYLNPENTLHIEIDEDYTKLSLSGEPFKKEVTRELNNSLKHIKQTERELKLQEKFAGETPRYRIETLPIFKKIFNSNFKIKIGCRHHFGTSLSIALYRLHYPYNLAKEIITNYVDFHTEQSDTEKFTREEAYKTLAGIYEKNFFLKVSSEGMTAWLLAHNFSFKEARRLAAMVNKVDFERTTRSFLSSANCILEKSLLTGERIISKLNLDIHRNSLSHVYSILSALHVLVRIKDRRGKPYKIHLHKGYSHYYTTSSISHIPPLIRDLVNNLLKKIKKEELEELFRLIRELYLQEESSKRREVEEKIDKQIKELCAVYLGYDELMGNFKTRRWEVLADGGGP